MQKPCWGRTSDPLSKSLNRPKALFYKSMSWDAPLVQKQPQIRLHSSHLVTKWIHSKFEFPIGIENYVSDNYYGHEHDPLLYIGKAGMGLFLWISKQFPHISALIPP